MSAVEKTMGTFIIIVMLFGVARSAYSGSSLIPNSRGCWSKCGSRGGLCPKVCEENGYCCRKGFTDCPEDVAAFNPYPQHACIRVVLETTKKTGPSLIPNTRGCWSKCGLRGGLCPNVCGKNGFCCRKGFTDCPEDVAAFNPYPQHACILNYPAPTPTPSPTQCGMTRDKQTYIIGGVDATPGAWPWMASLQQLKNHICGATLLTSKWALTAAHCAKSMNVITLPEYTIKLGAHDLRIDEPSVQRVNIKRFINNPNWNPRGLIADLTLLELATPVILNERVNLVCLPKKDEYPPVGKECVLAGWGSVVWEGYSYHTLQEVKLPIAEGKKCQHVNDICVGKGPTLQSNGKQQPNACSGDSGGPLVCRKSDGSYQLEGVASFVFGQCEDYTAYAPVNKYIDWINSHINS